MTSDDKYFQQAYRVYMNLIWLNGEVGPGAGDVAGGADFPPTDTSVSGLYLAGDWIDTGLPATIESAVRSGHRAAQQIIDDRKFA